MAEIEESRLKALLSQEKYDVENEHKEADDILLDSLKRAGEWEVARLYEELRKKVGFWYA